MSDVAVWEDEIWQLINGKWKIQAQTIQFRFILAIGKKLSINAISSIYLKVQTFILWFVYLNVNLISR